MSTSEIATSEINPYSEAEATFKQRLSIIDSSIKAPTLVFIVCAALWLLTASLLALIASIQSTNGGFLSSCEWFTYGRVAAAAETAMLYGWGCNAAFGIGLWILYRLCQRPLQGGGYLVVAAIFWNASVDISLLGIFSGDLTNISRFEFPKTATPLAFISLSLIFVWSILAYRYREGKNVFISQWFILAAFLWFPWIFASAQMFLHCIPVRGTLQAVVGSWYAYNLYSLWLAPIALGATYYLIPKITGKPIPRYHLAIIGFIFYAFIAAWPGPRTLDGGPIPVWLATAGITSNVLLLIPVGIFFMTLYPAIFNNLRVIVKSPTLRFTVFGILSFMLVTVISSLSSLRCINEVTHFTFFTEGENQQSIYAFFSMVMFGAMYFIVPQITKQKWPSPLLISAHFGCAAVGILLILLSLYIGGWVQGVQLQAVENGAPLHSFMDVVKNTLPAIHVKTIGLILLGVAHLAFALNLLIIVSRSCCCCRCKSS